MTDSTQENLNSKKLARNIRHRLADMLGSQWSGALDAAMDEMLLDEIEKFGITKIPIELGGDTPFRKGFGEDLKEESCFLDQNDGETAWPLRKRDDDGPVPTSDVDVPWPIDGENARPRGQRSEGRCRSDAPYTAPRRRG